MSSIVSSQVRNGHAAVKTVASANLRKNASEQRRIASLAHTPPHGASSYTLTTGKSGDHYPVFELLSSIFNAPSPGEFQAHLEEPWYEPSDRLLLKHGTKIVSHLRLYHRDMHVGSQCLPVAGITELATRREYRGQGCATALLAAAERRMREDGTVLGLVRTTAPELFLRRGWSFCGRHCYSLAGTREILAQLSATEFSRVAALSPSPHESRAAPLSTRIWRHVERAALERLYAQNTRHACGPIQRSEEYWRWLISRRAYDAIYVAVEGPDKLDLDETPIVGYAVTKGDRIVEIMADPRRPAARTQLLARICGDAIERDVHSMRLDAPPNDPLHRLFVSAGGQYRWREIDSGQALMAKLLDPLDFLSRLLPSLHDRAKNAGLQLPTELGLQIGETKLRLVLTRRTARLERGKLGRSYITCGLHDLTPLFVGHLDAKSLPPDGPWQCSTRTAADLASVLFPRLPLWRPPLDELSA